MRRFLTLRLILIFAAGIVLAFGIALSARIALSAGIVPDMAFPDISFYSAPAQEAVYEPEKWNLILVNRDHCIPDNYYVELIRLENGGTEVDMRILPDLQNMFDDMRQQGLDPVVGEGYRTNREQKKMLWNKRFELLRQGYSCHEAAAMAKEWVAEPGTSEHELGLAVDINSISGEQEFDIYRWLADNAHRYGFILRYPEGKEEITGIAYEPWHYRYVGKAAAEEIHDTELTLEEYLVP